MSNLGGMNFDAQSTRSIGAFERKPGSTDRPPKETYFMNPFILTEDDTGISGVLYADFRCVIEAITPGRDFFNED
jgi:hypothetical protein